MKTSNEIIKKLNLIPHPEGGYFAETFRDQLGSVSHIYYLLKKGEISRWHKLKKNEILNFYDGDPIKIYLSKNAVDTSEVILGKDINVGNKYQYTVKAETWFSMCSLGEWSLIGCIVVPAFDYNDFELAPTNWKPGKK